VFTDTELPRISGSPTAEEVLQIWQSKSRDARDGIMLRLSARSSKLFGQNQKVNQEGANRPASPAMKMSIVWRLDRESTARCGALL